MWNYPLLLICGIGILIWQYYPSFYLSLFVKIIWIKKNVHTSGSWKRTSVLALRFISIRLVELVLGEGANAVRAFPPSGIQRRRQIEGRLFDSLYMAPYLLVHVVHLKHTSFSTYSLSLRWIKSFFLLFILVISHFF